MWHSAVLFSQVKTFRALNKDISPRASSAWTKWLKIRRRLVLKSRWRREVYKNYNALQGRITDLPLPPPHSGTEDSASLRPGYRDKWTFSSMEFLNGIPLEKPAQCSLMGLIKEQGDSVGGGSSWEFLIPEGFLGSTWMKPLTSTLTLSVSKMWALWACGTKKQKLRVTEVRCWEGFVFVLFLPLLSGNAREI